MKEEKIPQKEGNKKRGRKKNNRIKEMNGKTGEESCLWRGCGRR